METNKQTQTPTVGPSTAHLLQALRAIEAARNHFFEALAENLGDERAAKELHEHDAEFDAVRDLIEHEIGDNVRTWAFSLDETEPI